MVAGGPGRASESPPNLLKLGRAWGAKRRHRQHLPHRLGAWCRCPRTSESDETATVGAENVSQNSTLKTLNQLCQALRCWAALFEAGQVKLRPGRARDRKH